MREELIRKKQSSPELWSFHTYSAILQRTPVSEAHYRIKRAKNSQLLCSRSRTVTYQSNFVALIMELKFVAQWLSGTELHVWKKVGLISFSIFYLLYLCKFGRNIFTNTWWYYLLLLIYCSNALNLYL